MRSKCLFLIAGILVATTCLGVKGSLQASEELVLRTVESPTETYTIIEKLGEGLFSDVFAVQDSQGNRFALKAYKYDEANLFQGPFLSPLADIEREFRRGQMLDHPNILKHFDYFADRSESGQYIGYLVMELIKGKIFYDYERNSFSGAEAIALGQQLVETLQYAHSLGLEYLDLHQGNVMCDEEKNLKIIDVASFFSFDELRRFFENDENSSSTVQSKKVNTAEGHRLSPLREKQLKHFFLRNPELCRNIKKALREQNGALPKGDVYPVHSSYVRLRMEPMMMDRIAELCRNLVLKSAISKDDKLDLFIKIKKVSWNFQESYAEGENPSFDHCFEELSLALDHP